MANIRSYLNKIRTAIFGQEVRSSLADGLEAVNKETEVATKVTNETKERQDHVEARYDAAVGAHTEDSEVLDSRVDTAGHEHINLKKRLDIEHEQVNHKIELIAINVRHFGVMGDGKSDDTQAIQSVLNSHRDVYFPEGNYKITDTISIPPDTHLSLHPNARIYFENETVMGSHMFINGYRGMEVTGYDGWSNITIEGGIFDANYPHFQQTHTFNHVIFGFGYAKNITLRKVRMTHVQNNHYIDLAGVDGFICQQCTFDGASVTWARGVPHEMLQIDVAFTHTFPPFGSGGGNHSINVLIENCTFEGGEVGIGGHSFNRQNHSFFENITIRDNHFRNMTQSSINMPRLKDSLIKNNIIERCGNTAIYLRGCQDTAILSNTLSSVKGRGIDVERLTEGGQHYDGLNLVMANNILTNVENAGIGIQYVENTQLINNTFFDVAQKPDRQSSCPISVRDCDHVNLFNNSFKNSTAPTFDFGVFISTTSTQVATRNNNFLMGLVDVIPNSTRPDIIFEGEKRLFSGDKQTGDITLSEDVTQFRELRVSVGYPSLTNFNTAYIRAFGISNLRVDDGFVVHVGTGIMRFRILNRRTLRIVESVANETIGVRTVFGIL